jgi:MtrB/PioB family decaheme-associated outer membrane protein
MAMNRKTLCSVLSGALLVIPAVTSYAEEVEPEEKATAEVEKERFITHGDVTIGAQSVEQNNNSSKFNEYKDDETDLYLYRLNVGVDDTETGLYFGFIGSRLSRDDQEMLLEFGMAGRFSLDFSLKETPHLLSNNAKTPYDYLGGGTYRVADGIVNSIQISNVNNASSWTAADAGPGLGGEDARINSVLNNSVHHMDLGTLRRDGTLELSYNLTDRTTARLEFGSSTKDGSIVTGTSIGDRPPRSLVAQLPEPIDYRTDDIKLSLAFNGDSYQIDTTYQYSQFENSNDTLTWNSLFHAPGFFNPAATDYDDIRIGFGTSYATTGKIALSPDNTYHNLMVNAGFNLPLASRLTASLAIGKMLQDETLLPYATSDFGGTLSSLPRTSADAEINTKMLNLSYNINPISKLNAKLHYRYYDLDNDTPQSEFDYYTQDTDSQAYLNERINLAYGYTQNNYGLDLSYYLGKMGTLGFAYENDKKDRDFREVAETDEDIFKLSYRVSPIDKVSVNAKYTKAKRDGSTYNSEITDLSYHYDPTDPANQAQSNNPLLGFGNAPGLRKYDVTDRDRDEFSLGLGFVPTDTVNINMSYRNTKNDYASDTPSTITTWDSVALAMVTTSIDPTQLGLLEDQANTYVVDLTFTPVEALTFNGYLSRETLDSKQRGRYMDEDNRINNITTTTKDWEDTSGDYLWNADFTDTTNTVGIGAKYAINNNYDIGADFTHSRGTVDIKYSAGDLIAEDDILNPPGSHAWAEWSSPDEVKFRTNTLALNVTRHMNKNLDIGFRYMYQKYEVTDWQQAASGAHQNPLGDNFVADNDPETAGTSQDRAGSRLVRLSDYLAPDYNVNVFYLTVGYTW